MEASCSSNKLLFPHKAQTHPAKHLETFSSKSLDVRSSICHINSGATTSASLPQEQFPEIWCGRNGVEQFSVVITETNPNSLACTGLGRANPSSSVSWKWSLFTINLFIYHWNIFIVHLIYWVVQGSWFARVNALCNLSHKKSWKVAAVNARPIYE